MEEPSGEAEVEVLRLYVGGFPLSTSSSELKATLQRAVKGPVDVDLMRTAQGHSRGYAFASVSSGSRGGTRPKCECRKLSSRALTSSS